MFDIGFSEILVIAIIALLVLGPERLPKAARFVGLWVRRARAQWYSVKSELESDLLDEELKRDLGRARDQLQGEMRDLRDGLQQGAHAVGEELRAANPAHGAAGGEPSKPAVDLATPQTFPRSGKPVENGGRESGSAVDGYASDIDDGRPAGDEPRRDAPP